MAKSIMYSLISAVLLCSVAGRHMVKRQVPAINEIEYGISTVDKEIPDAVGIIREANEYLEESISEVPNEATGSEISLVGTVSNMADGLENELNESVDGSDSKVQELQGTLSEVGREVAEKVDEKETTLTHATDGISGDLKETANGANSELNHGILELESEVQDLPIKLPDIGNLPADVLEKYVDQLTNNLHNVEI